MKAFFIVIFLLPAILFSPLLHAETLPRGVSAQIYDPRAGSLGNLSRYGFDPYIKYGYEKSDPSDGSQGFQIAINVSSDALSISQNKRNRIHNLATARYPEAFNLENKPDYNINPEVSDIVKSSLAGTSVKLFKKRKVYAVCKLHQNQFYVGTIRNADYVFSTLMLTDFRCVDPRTRKVKTPSPELNDKAEVTIPLAKISTIIWFRYFY